MGSYVRGVVVIFTWFCECVGFFVGAVKAGSVCVYSERYIM